MKPINLLFALGALLGGAGTLFYFGAANSDTTAVAPAPIPYVKATELLRYASPGRLALHSQVALVMDERDGIMLYGRAIDTPRPIASLTKLMTALVVLESELPLDAPIAITTDDRDRLKGSRSRLHIGAILTRDDLLRAALSASDNRAAAALARTAPGGTEAFVAAMNTKAQALGMTNTRFADASGLNPRNARPRATCSNCSKPRAPSRACMHSPPPANSGSPTSPPAAPSNSSTPTVWYARMAGRWP